VKDTAELGWGGKHRVKDTAELYLLLHVNAHFLYPYLQILCNFIDTKQPGLEILIFTKSLDYGK